MYGVCAVRVQGVSQARHVGSKGREAYGLGPTHLSRALKVALVVDCESLCHLQRGQRLRKVCPDAVLIGHAIQS